MAASSKPQGWGTGKLPESTTVKHPKGWLGAGTQRQVDQQSGKR